MMVVPVHIRLGLLMGAVIVSGACALPVPRPVASTDGVASAPPAEAALPSDTFSCTYLGNSTPGQEAVLVEAGDGVPVVFVGESAWACPCEFRHLAGSQEDRQLAGASEDRTIGGASEDRTIGGASEDRTIGGASEDRTIGGASEDRTIGGASEDRTIGGASEDRTIGGASEDRTIGGASEDRTIGGASEDRTIGGASEDRTIGGASEDRTIGGASEGRLLAGSGEQITCTIAPEQCPRFLVSGTLPLRWFDGDRLINGADRCVR